MNFKQWVGSIQGLPPGQEAHRGIGEIISGTIKGGLPIIAGAVAGGPVGAIAGARATAASMGRPIAGRRQLTAAQAARFRAWLARRHQPVAPIVRYGLAPGHPAAVAAEDVAVFAAPVTRFRDSD